MLPKKVSVIVSTYNRPKALFIVLSCLCRQTDDNFEIIVADDGSDSPTKAVLNNVQKQFPDRTILHVWQENLGFRLARVRNLAVKQATGDYLVFLDGDCVPPPDFISNHRSLAETGWAVYGQRILANKIYTNYIESNFEILFNNKYWSFFNFLTLFIQQKINRLSPLIHIPGNLWRKSNPNHWNKIRGCNWAIWIKDYVSINGSDETFEGWGAEDKDVAVRLLNYGIHLKDGRNASYVFHLWHPLTSRHRDHIQTNIVNTRLKEKTIYPTIGMNKRN